MARAQWIFTSQPLGSRSRAKGRQEGFRLRVVCTDLALRMMLKIVARDVGMEASFHRSCAELAGTLGDHDVIVLGQFDARVERAAAWDLLVSLPSGSALLFVNGPHEAARADKLGQLALTMPVTLVDLEIYIDALLAMARARKLSGQIP